MHTFAFTPDTEPMVNSHYLADSDEDTLPTLFPSRTRSGSLHEGRNPVSGEGAFTVPAKRKQRSSGSEALSLPGTVDGLSATPQQGIGKTPTRTRDISTIGPSSPRASSTRLRSSRVVLDAVEIVSRKRPRRQRTVGNGCPTESDHKSASSHYPSPPVSHGSKHGDDSHSVVTENCAHLDLTLLMKTSKYFTPTSIIPTQSLTERTSVPGSPILTIPVYIESSSDSEYPPPAISLDLREDNPLDELLWTNNSGLFSDLMIMLRRLKPILIQESVRDDPWKVLIAVRLLNVTTGKAAIPVFCKIISRWPTPQDLVHAAQDELVELLRPLGLYNKRACWLKNISEHFLEDQQVRSSSETPLASFLSEKCIVPLSHYPGVGPYASDSLRIFCEDDKDTWKQVMPQDKELVRYLRWRWAVEEGKVWYPGVGVVGEMNVPYLITLVDELAMHYDNTIGGEGYIYHFCNDLCGVLTGDMTEQSIL